MLPDVENPNAEYVEPVFAPRGDSKGFDPYYQKTLRQRVIGEHLAPILGFIPKADTIQEVPIMKAAPSRERGLVTTHISTRVVTSNEQSAAQRERVRRETTG